MATYQVHGVRNVSEVASEINQLWTDETIRAEARAKGIDLASLPSSSGEALTVTRAGAGMEPGTTAIIVAFAPVAAKVAADLWTRVLLPRLERRFGMRPMESK